MKDINLTENQAQRLVDSVFKANAVQRGHICDWPVIGGHYVVGSDPIKKRKGKAVRALLARDWFADNGPPGAQPLPLSHDEREDMKSGRGLLAYIVALYARSLEGRDYNVKEHPPFSDYASGVLWEAQRADGDIGGLPNYPEKQLTELKKRFRPRMLPGMSLGFSWEPPEQAAQTLARYRRYRARAAS